jgi:hypothetical protein
MLAQLGKCLIDSNCVGGQVLRRSRACRLEVEEVAAQVRQKYRDVLTAGCILAVLFLTLELPETSTHGVGRCSPLLASPRRSSLSSDLRNVTTISQEGENILLGMMQDGAKFVCGGTLNRHVLPTSERCLAGMRLDLPHEEQVRISGMNLF